MRAERSYIERTLALRTLQAALVRRIGDRLTDKEASGVLLELANLPQTTLAELPRDTVVASEDVGGLRRR